MKKFIFIFILILMFAASPLYAAYTYNPFTDNLDISGDTTSTGTSNWTDVGASDAYLAGDAGIEGDLTAGSITIEDATTSDGTISGSGDLTIGFNSVRVTSDFNINDKVIYVDAVSEIQPAIDTLEAAQGGTIYILPGTYTVTTGLTISGTDPIILRGQGVGTGGRGTTIINSTGINLLTIGREDAQSNNESVSVENIRFFGDASVPASGSGVKIQNISAGVVFRGCRFWSNNIGVNIIALNANDVYNVFFKECSFSSNTVGLRVETNAGDAGSFNNFTTYESCFFNDNDTHIELESGAGAGEVSYHKFTDCYMDDTNAAHVFMNLTNSDNNQFTSCTFDGTDASTMITIDTDSRRNKFVSCTFDCQVDATNNQSVVFTPFEYGEHKITSRAEDDAGNSLDLFTISNADGGVGADTAILKLNHTDDGESNAKFIQMYDNSGADLKYSFGVDTLLNGDGNVGIGTATPDASLDILQSASAPYKDMLNIDTLTTTGAFHVDENGNVGIGDSTPTSLLDILKGSSYWKTNPSGFSTTVSSSRDSTNHSNTYSFLTSAVLDWTIGLSDTDQFGDGTEFFIGTTDDSPEFIISTDGLVSLSNDMSVGTDLTVDGTIYGSGDATTINDGLTVSGEDVFFSGISEGNTQPAGVATGEMWYDLDDDVYRRGA